MVSPADVAFTFPIFSHRNLNTCSGGSKGVARDARPPGGPNSFNFMQFMDKFCKIVC